MHEAPPATHPTPTLWLGEYACPGIQPQNHLSLARARSPPLPERNRIPICRERGRRGSSHCLPAAPAARQSAPRTELCAQRRCRAYRSLVVGTYQKFCGPVHQSLEGWGSKRGWVGTTRPGHRPAGLCDCTTDLHLTLGVPAPQPARPLACSAAPIMPTYRASMRRAATGMAHCRASSPRSLTASWLNPCTGGRCRGGGEWSSDQH